MIHLPVYRHGRVAAHALLDDQDAGLALVRWWLRADGYVQRCTTIEGRDVTLQLGRVVLGLEPGNPLLADHINHNTLDNQRGNLRAVTNRENQQNRRGASARNQSGLRGVCFNKRSGRFRAYCAADYLGQFTTAQEAAAVAAAARKERGYLEGAA